MTSWNDLLLDCLTVDSTSGYFCGFAALDRYFSVSAGTSTIGPLGSLCLSEVVSDWLFADDELPRFERVDDCRLVEGRGRADGHDVHVVAIQHRPVVAERQRDEKPL